jgi:cupin superfamily acireductone dioxygenase involved in methionine salvage
MLSDITTGNTKTDGHDFRFWFVGRVEKWCRENNIPFDKEKYGLRNTDNIEIKWGIYKKDEVRNIWASSSDKTAMSILIRGDFIFIFREMQDHSKSKEVRLKNEGDYVIWREDMEHTWRMDEDSVILTLRWSSKR